MADEQVYTRDELDKLSRTNLRRAAVSCGKSHRDATKMRADEIKDFILSKQDGGEESPKKTRVEKGGRKAATAKVRGRGKVAATKNEPEPEPEVEEKQDRDNGDAEGIADLIHKVGLGMDDGFKEIMGVVEDLQTKLEEQASAIQELQHSVFILSGLTTDVLRIDWEPDDVDARLEELETAWQDQADDDGNGDDEGNEE